MISTYSLRTVSDLEPGDHLCCLCKTKEERRALLSAFIRQGFERGEKILYIVDPPTDECFLDYLPAEEIKAYLASGQLNILTADETYLQEGVFDPDRMIARLQAETDRALAEGYTALRVTSVATWVKQGHSGSERLIEYEHKLNTFFSGNKCLALCQYDQRHFEPDSLLAVLAAHPTAVVGSEVYDNFYYIPPTDIEQYGLPEATLRRWLDNLAARKRAEEVLRESEEKYRSLRQQTQIIDQIHDAVISTDLAGYVTSWNKGAERLTGYSRQEALEQHISFIYPQDQHTFLQQGVIAPLKAKGNHEVEVRMQNKTGEAFYAHLSLSLLRDSTGSVTGMIGYSMDITERKQAEEILKRYILRLEVLQKIALAILSAQSPQAIAKAAIHYIRHLLVPCQRASVILFDFQANKVVRLVVSVNDNTNLGTGESIPLDDFVDITNLRQGRHYIVNDIQAIARRSPTDEKLLAEGLRSYIYVSLISQGKLIGSLSLGATTPKAFNLEHVEIANEVASLLAVAIQNAQLFEQVHAGRERLRRLTQQVVSAQEEERQRVSRELHDEAGQALTALKISLELIQADLPPESLSLRDHLREIVTLADETVERIRLLAHDLRPSALDAVGLNPTLEDLCRDFAKHTQLAVDYVGVTLPVLPDPIKICLYRILQEALTNVAKHAHASQVRVVLGYDDDWISLLVVDDGRGFDKQLQTTAPNQLPGIGLLGMRERLELLGGHLEIESRPGQGTRLVARVPWKETV